MSTPSNAGSEVEELYQRVVDFIHANESQNAIRLIQDQADNAQLSILSQLTHELARALDRALDLNRNRDRDLDRSFALALAYALTLALRRALALDHERDMYITRALALTHDFDQALARDLTLVRDLDRDLDLGHMRLSVNVILHVLDDLSSLTTIRLVHIEAITPDTLSDQIVPYLQALAALQQTIAEIKNIKYEQPTIQKIETNSRSIDLTGVKEAVEVLHDIIVPWQHQNAQKLAPIEIQEHGFNAMEQAKLDMYFQVIESLGVDLNEREKLYYLTRMMRHLNTLATHFVEIKIDTDEPQ